MAQIFKNCNNCGKILTIDNNKNITKCESCFCEFETSSLLDDSDRTFFKHFNSADIDISLKYNALIIQGNDYIFMQQYQQAEEAFKQAISLNENRYEAYYGITRAKTQDFQILPDNNDYLEYAKIALSLADDDIDSKINANLAKINIYKQKK